MASKRRAPRKKPATRKAAQSSATAVATLEATASALGTTNQAVAGKARTILYVHGIGNKPPADILKCQWDDALFGFNLGERSRLAYWVNRIFYPEPSKASCKMADATQDLVAAEAGAIAIRAIADPAEGIDPLLPPEAKRKQERDVLARIAERTLGQNIPSAAIGAADYHARVLPLPEPLREFITRRITRAFLKDVHEFLFVKERREIMRESVMARLRTGGGPFIVIAHSQGSMVAYEALSSLTKADGIEVDLFITIGSPLGLKEVQDQLKVVTGQKKSLAVPAIVNRWVNVADPLDPVCADKRLSSDYAATNGVRVEDFVQWNADSPRDPHSGSGYLRLSEVRGPVRDAIDRDLFQRIAPFTIARDLVTQMEASHVEERHPVLIELRDQWDNDQSRTADEVRADVVSWIERSLRNAKPRLTPEDVDLEALSGYVSARLTRPEVERMSSELQLDSVYRVFRNARKRALLDQSINALQCSTAHRGYDSRG
ncbi:MAG TPA: hypothetical protein VIU34_08775, partial [Steroidobacter sp.]